MIVIDHTGGPATEMVRVVNGSLNTPSGRFSEGDEVELPVAEALRLRRLGLAVKARMVVHHREIAEREFTTGPDYPFPEPWFPRQSIGEYELVPIEAAADLYAESFAMGHCVGINAKHVSDGNQFAFSIRQKGVRVATLLIAHEPPWISDVKGHHHVEVPEIEAVISAWLATQPVKIRPFNDGH